MENRSAVRGGHRVAAGARADDAEQVLASKKTAPAVASTAIKRQLAARARVVREEQARQKAVAKFQHQHSKSRYGRTAPVVLIAGLLLLALAALLALNDPRSLRQNISGAVQALSWNDPRGWFPSVEAMGNAVEKTLADALQRLDQDTAEPAIIPEPASIPEPANIKAAPVLENNPGSANTALSSAWEAVVVPEQDTSMAAAKYRQAARLLGLVAQTQPALAEDPRLRSLIAEMQRAAEQEEQLAAGGIPAGRGERRDGTDSVQIEKAK